MRALRLAATVPAADQQVLVLNAERFAIPEALFRPADIGLAECGVHEAVAEAIGAAPRALRPALWSSIVLAGGGARMPGFEARLARELRALAPAGAVVRVYTADEPDTAAWAGGARWAAGAGGDFRDACVSRAEYAEEGERVCARRFAPGGQAET